MTTTADDALSQAISKVRARIAQHMDRQNSIGEQNTKAALIEPVLIALGWTLDEFDEVRREYRSKSQDNPVDYALFINNIPCLFIEAKALGVDISDRRCILQVLRYANDVGVKWCVLTNGDEYRLYKTHEPVDAEEKLFLTIHLSDESQYELTFNTLHLLTKENMDKKAIDAHWKIYSVDRYVKAAIENLMTGSNQVFNRLIKKISPSLTFADIHDSLSRADIIISMRSMQNIIISSTEQTDQVLHRRRKNKVAELSEKRSERNHRITIKDLIVAGFLQPPVNLVKVYKGKHLTATIDKNGSLNYLGQPYDSPSTAAGFARQSVVGALPGYENRPTNGWAFWQITDQETGKLIEIDILRQRYLASIKLE